MKLYCIVTQDNVQQTVKNETSQIAVRTDKTTPNNEVVNLYEEITMDEHYDALFKRYFAESEAEVMSFIPPQYIYHTATDTESIFPEDLEDGDFEIYLDIQREFMPQYAKSIQTKLNQFFIDYIIWRWLETKLPDQAILFHSRLEKLKEDILKLINKRVKPLRRLPSYP